ncbi:MULTISPECIES: GDP-L-fucose synthase family protein [Filomicrobium]|uniref:GDP-L-fucose synthase family protein n=1 Tax=Filomicrobium TaxID=119044 RepID=UPI00244EBD8F|nr:MULTISPECIES: GDP-L-fucose synthase [Filomicrobium]
MTKLYKLAGKRIYVAGHRGMVGAALVRQLRKLGMEPLTTSRDEVDLRNQADVRHWFEVHKPDVVFLAAATVGGILANATRPAEFIYDNLVIETNVIDAAHRNDTERVIFLGSSCIYPKHAPQPISEDSLLTGPLEPTNQWYAIAKIAGVKLAQAYREQYGRHYISVMPTNLYGRGDNFNLEGAHVIPALMRKAHEAKLAGSDKLSVWGTGQVRREFLLVDDLADALVFLAEHYDAPDPINVGVGSDIAIKELATLICDVVGFEGELATDPTKPDGTPRKLMDVSRINSLGWHAQTSLDVGLRDTYDWYLQNLGKVRS